MQLTEGISAVIPVYNSSGTLEPLMARLERCLAALSPSFEIILVNDGSRDDSWSVITSLSERYGCLRGINLMRNYGQHNALLVGIQQARFDTTVTLDDDLQNPPEEMGKLIEKLREGYDVVYGTPARESHGLWRDLASQATKLALQSAMGAETARNVSAYRAFRTQVREGFRQYSSPDVSIDVLLTWATTKFAAIPVRQDARAVGVSNYTVRRLITHALNMTTGFSMLPLQLASVVGFAFTTFGLAILAYVVVRYFTVSQGVPGFPFLASMIAIFSGAQLFALGIIGEYLARMYFRNMGRPYAVIRQTVDQTIDQAVAPESLDRLRTAATTEQTAIRRAGAA
ncbi:MAG: glycosyltransferase family 2 protein [Chloroflexota bacterium]